MSDSETTTNPSMPILTPNICRCCEALATDELIARGDFRVPSLREIETFITKVLGRNDRVVKEEDLLSVLFCVRCQPDMEKQGMKFHRVEATIRLIGEDRKKREVEEARQREAKALAEEQRKQAQVRREQIAGVAVMFGHSGEAVQPRVVGRVEMADIIPFRGRRDNGYGFHQPFAELAKTSRRQDGRGRKNARK